ncbi:MAG: TIGR03619 family F420-dependent LLM class oxidoreductase [Candidatus Rokubacteria bacterium]|nr:TIGR03619 family F420-dependent LLM class oxidoreductase [Candidatus Rokubacteria bacterium]
MPLAVAVPQTFPDGRVDIARVRQFVTRAEALRFDSLWTVEQILGGVPSLDPVDTLTYAAALTSRIRLGAAVLLTALRSPVHLAKQLATIDHLSGGRLVVGVGVGNPRAYEIMGIPTARRGARFAESVRLMRALWTEPRVSFAGEFWRVTDARMEPKPVQQPHPPIWFGGHHPNALRRAVELGDGFVGAGSIATATFAEQTTVLRRLLADAGRDPAAFPVGKRVYVAIDRDRDRAGRRLGEWFAAFYGRAELAAEVAVWGDVQECVDRLAAVAAAGARFLLLNPVFDDLEHLERFAADLAPKL